MKFLPDFRRHFPGIDPVPLVASVLFYTPMVRDLISWCGVRQVGLPIKPGMQSAHDAGLLWS